MLKATNGMSASIWMATATVPEFPALASELKTDVCVIGAGETGRTTAHFFPPDEWYVDVESGFGIDKARLSETGYTSLPCTGMNMGNCTHCRPNARISAVLCTGIPPNAHGTALAMDPALIRRVK